ncbi:MAG: anthranilate phosphoribosyltransferase [Nitrospirae bacterium]|nr:anthranilate phosphoribosyltransferase [Nitrospirota bacterium]
MTPREALLALVKRESLSRQEMRGIMGEMMDGKVEDALLAGITVALLAKGETPQEIAGAVDALRARQCPFPENGEDAIDVCGTGGDRSGSVNLSTAVSFALAGGGVKVIKHGNRAVSSRAGSADVLEAMGLRVDMTPEDAARLYRETGLTFLFAPLYHPALRIVSGVRRELGIRTFFNLLGPLVNPARVPRQVVGVYGPDRLETVVDVLISTGSREVVALFGDGLDEVNLSSTTTMLHYAGGKKTWSEFTAKDLGLEASPLSAAMGGDRDRNAALICRILEGERFPLRNWVLAGAAPAFLVAGKVSTLREGVEAAGKAIDSGAAMGVYRRWKEVQGA